MSWWAPSHAACRVSTFHSACVRILRRDAAAAGLKSSFTIYDSADSLRLITTIAKDLELDTKKHAPRALAFRISTLKNDLIDPIDFADQAESAKNPFEKTLARIYTNYTERLRQANAVDFDDLIGLTVTLLRENPAIREGYHRRFRHLLVDEYQDTNTAQYQLVRELVGEDPTPISPWSATRTSRSTPSAVPPSATSSNSSRTSPRLAPSCSSRTTAPPRTSSPPPTR